MIVYHGTVEVIKKPDVFHSFRPLDFGKGFYLTTLYGQAERYGERFIRRGEMAILNTFLLDDVRTDCTILKV